MKILISGLCVALLLTAPAAEAAKTHKIRHLAKPAACPVQSTALSIEHGVTVYRAAPRPWRPEAATPPEPVVAKPVVVVVRDRYHYLAVDTRTRGEWGPMYAVYQKF